MTGHWNVAIMSDFRSEEGQLKALKNCQCLWSALLLHHNMSWNEAWYPAPHPPSSAPAALLLFLHLSSAWKNRERERERVPENECGGRDIIAFLSFFASLPKGGGIAVSDWGYLHRTICWRSTLMNSALKVWVCAAHKKKTLSCNYCNLKTTIATVQSWKWKIKAFRHFKQNFFLFKQSKEKETFTYLWSQPNWFISQFFGYFTSTQFPSEKRTTCKFTFR